MLLALPKARDSGRCWGTIPIVWVMSAPRPLWTNAFQGRFRKSKSLRTCMHKMSQFQHLSYKYYIFFIKVTQSNFKKVKITQNESSRTFLLMWRWRAAKFMHGAYDQLKVLLTLPHLLWHGTGFPGPPHLVAAYEEHVYWGPIRV
jgi:hypothetical protein